MQEYTIAPKEDKVAQLKDSLKENYAGVAVLNGEIVSVYTKSDIATDKNAIEAVLGKSVNKKV